MFSVPKAGSTERQTRQISENSHSPLSAYQILGGRTLQGDRQAEPAIHRVTRQEHVNQLVVFSEL